MRGLFRKLRGLRFRYEPLVGIFIHRARILHNFAQFQEANPEVALAPVLKANAYGHGLVEVARILEGQRIPFLCVDSYFEALILRNEGVRTPLLIIGYTPLENIVHSKLRNVAFGMTSLEELWRLSRGFTGKRVTIHLKIDTGMHRQGVLPSEALEALDAIGHNPRIALEGAYSHLADADTEHSALTKTQIEGWNAAARMIREREAGVRYFHLGNTAGSYHSPKIDANVIRLGIGLYGMNTSLNRKLDLKPALEMRTRLTSVRAVRPGESVGYNATYTAKETITAGTIPVGYAEGIDRRLSNKGAATIQGVSCPFVGRVNMNVTSLDISRVPNPKIDDEVLVVSADRDAPNSIERMAHLCDTIPYELLIRFPAQIRRRVV